MERLVYRHGVPRHQIGRLTGTRLQTVLATAALAIAVVGCAPDDTPAGAAVDGDSAVSRTRLYTFDCGHIEVLDLAQFDRAGAYDGRQATLVDQCFLIRHPDGDLLWDTGIDDAINDMPDGVLSSSMRFTMPRTLEDQLVELGLGADDIEYVALSHSHYDHVGNAGDYASTTWLVDAAERDFMFRDEARADTETFSLYSALETADTIIFTDDYDVFGDGSVVIVQTPGHTPGHTSLLVRLDETGPVLLSGDLYHFAEAREKRTIPVFNTDPEQTLRSMDRFEALAESTGALVVIQHDPGDYAALPHAPEFLD